MFSVYSLKTLAIKEPTLQTKHFSEPNNQCRGVWVLGLSPGADKNMEGVLLVRGGVTTPSEHYTLEQCTKSTNAHRGPCDEIVT